MGLRCKRCGSGEQVKNGPMRGRQRYRRRTCGPNFADAPPRGMPLAIKVTAVLLYLSGLSMDRTARLLGVSTPSVMAWVEQLAKAYAQKPEPEGRALVVELDEVWHYLKKANRLWVWKARDRASGRVVDGECGGRDAATLGRLLARVERRKPRLYCADDRAACAELIPQGRLFVGKAEAHGIERGHARQRHWLLARFRRRSTVVSKAIRMVEASIALFARFGGDARIGDLVAMLA
jgi:IS1 family transposase/transposase-like protein